jgi:hypothetical protein
MCEEQAVEVWEDLGRVSSPHVRSPNESLRKARVDLSLLVGRMGVQPAADVRPTPLPIEA